MSQVNALKQVAARQFVVASVDSQGYFSIASRPFFHPSINDANGECQRLAVMHPGKAFVALQLAGGALANGVQVL